MERMDTSVAGGAWSAAFCVSSLELWSDGVGTLCKVELFSSANVKRSERKEEIRRIRDERDRAGECGPCRSDSFPRTKLFVNFLFENDEAAIVSLRGRPCSASPLPATRQRCGRKLFNYVSLSLSSGNS